MKRSFLILILILKIFLIKSQEYHPLLGDSNKWYMMISFEGTDTWIFFANEDTIIKDIKYKVVRWESDGQLFGFIRRYD